MLRLLLVSIFFVFTSIVNAEPVNINESDAQELADSLNGVDPKKAQAIIEYREINGPFYSAEEIVNVKGIGPKNIREEY